VGHATSPLRYSLVVATVGRPAELSRLLASVAQQEPADVQIVVVDQSAGLHVRDVLEAVDATRRVDVRYVRDEGRGLSRARNRGLAVATGDILAFPDDDCWYPRGLLAKVATYFQDSQPLFGGVTGRASYVGSGIAAARFDDVPGPLTRSNVWRRTCSYTMFLRRAAVEAAGPFDETLGVGAGTPWAGAEDIDYPLRVLDAGYELAYDPDLRVHHPAPDGEGGELARRAFQYGAGIGRVWRKHGYPASAVSYYVARPLLGAAVSLAGGNPKLARTRWASFRGRLYGWR
jgi:GT2 family glycosyltransferase